jgi:CPA1 family monovalent cation:H+ antiporter
LAVAVEEEDSRLRGNDEVGLESQQPGVSGQVVLADREEPYKWPRSGNDSFFRGGTAMTALGVFAALLALAAVFGVVNARVLKLPNTIGVLIIALVVSLLVIAVNPFVPGIDIRELPRRVLGSVDLPRALLNFVLSFLLFAGTLQVDISQLWARKFAILALAILGTLISIVLFAGGMFLLFPMVGVGVPLIWCLVLGAILAPTDPVSVGGILRTLGLPAPLQAVFAGESLFNDGVAVVLFGAALDVATGNVDVLSGAEIFSEFLIEAVGGGILGVALGYIALQMVRAVTDSHLELIISLALATGTFSLANALGLSGPIAVVAAGLIMGSRRGRDMLTDDGHRELMMFWGLLDEILNILLFLLIGFEILSVALQWSHLLAVLAAIPLAVVVRGISVVASTLPIHIYNRGRAGALVVLTWGGLGGGISVALALGLPDSPARPALLAVAYGVVVFTIVVQGLTLQRVARWFYKVEQGK